MNVSVTDDQGSVLASIDVEAADVQAAIGLAYDDVVAKNAGLPATSTLPLPAKTGWVTWPPGRILRKGCEYLVRTKTGGQKYAREHRMSYLDQNELGELIFNARPYAGTQSFLPSTIVATRYLGVSPGRDDDRRYMNRIVR